MTVTSQLIGTIGGEPEKQAVSVDVSSTSISIPSGWKKAAGIFAGTAGNTTNAVVFSVTTRVDGGLRNQPISGGAEVASGTSVTFKYVTGTVTWYKLA